MAKTPTTKTVATFKHNEAMRKIGQTGATRDICCCQFCYHFSASATVFATTSLLSMVLLSLLV